MKKLLLMGTLLTAMTAQAQESANITLYWPNERATKLQSGTQYFIYNTANDGKDRSWFIYSDGSTLKTNNVSPKTFITKDNSYLFTAKKPENPSHETHWYLNSAHGIVEHGGQTNNTEARDLFIAPWFGNDQITKSTAKSEDEEGQIQNPNEVDTKVWAITNIAGLNPEPGDANKEYAWNGNDGGAGLGGLWTRWSQAHPYAFYTIASKTLEGEAAQAYLELTNRTGLFSNIAFLLQQNYGLVQDGNKYYCNYPELTPAENSFYTNLIDGNDNTYFHSSWQEGDIKPEIPNHYLRAELTNATKEFYFIFKRRTSNNNNRPTSILIEGSNEAEGTYSQITTVESLPTAANEYFYFSDKISTSGNSYKYIRFTPQGTNNNSKFFTFSEFYIIEANEQTNNEIKTIKDFYKNNENIKEDNFEANILGLYQNTLNVQETLNLTLARNLLNANASNHADDPALGQYPTDAYNALEAVADKEQVTTSELNEAIKAFKFSINAPVFTINGTFSGSYQSKGKSIYYKAGDNTNPLWWDKATNKYDKTMLWKFAGSTSTSAKVGQTYTAMNLAEDVYFWNIEQIRVKATDPTNQDGIVLINTAESNTTIHAQSDGRVVYWDNTNPTSASGWTITYVGESFDIDQIDEEKLAAYATLKTLVSECEPYSGHIGNGLNQFSCEGHDFEKALADAKVITDQDIYQNHELDARPALAALQAAKKVLAINQPEAGKYYRIKSKSSGKYISSEKAENGNLKLVDAANDASTVFFLSADKKLTNSKVLNMKGASVSENELSDSYDFQAHNDRGMYLIKPSSSNPLYDHSATSGAVDVWSTNPAAEAKCAWIIEEVSDAAQQPKLTKTMTAEYATLAAPVALNIPADVKAYTVTVDETKETAILNEVAEVIPAGVAVLLKKEGAASNFDFTYAPEGATDNKNALVGVYKETAVGGDINAYILGNGSKGLGFYQMDKTDRTLGANKAYLVLPKEAQAIRSIVIGGPTTGIEETVAEGAEAEEYYDLQGRRVMNPTKGIYVTKSGKKVIFNK